MNYPSAMSTQPPSPFEQQPYPPAAPSQGTPQGGYPQQGYPQPAAPMPNYPQPGYPQAYPQAMYVPTPAVRKNPAVGVISAVVVAVAAILGNYAMVGMIPAVKASLHGGRRANNSTWLYEQLGDSAQAIGVALYSSLFLGFVAFILAIVAISSGRGRGLGVAALLVSLVGPVVSFFILGTLSAGAA
jgi:hypothetical protein